MPISVAACYCFPSEPVLFAAFARLASICRFGANFLPDFSSLRSIRRLRNNGINLSFPNLCGAAVFEAGDRGTTPLTAGR